MTSLIRRHPLIAYFVLTYAFTWGLFIPLQPVYQAGNDWAALLLVLGIFGPALVAIGLSALINPRPRRGSRRAAVVAFLVAWPVAATALLLQDRFGEDLEVTSGLVIGRMLVAVLPAFVLAGAFSTVPGIRDLLSSYARPPGAPGYYVLALLLIPAIWTGGLLLTRVLGMDMPNARYSTFDAELLVLIVLLFLSNFIHGGLSEEPGWRGFALPRLQARFSPLVSSLILGVIWAVWHAPARFGGVEAKSVEDTGVEWMLIVLLSIIFTWLYNRTKGSVLVGALLHASMNATGHFLPATLFALALLIAVVIFAIVSDRMWAVTDHGHRSILSD